MIILRVYTTIGELSRRTCQGVEIDVNCDYATWLYGAYELLGIDYTKCLKDSPIDTLIRIERELRLERSPIKMRRLREELHDVRRALAKGVEDDVLLALANRILQYEQGLRLIEAYLAKINSLSCIELSKLIMALCRYNMPKLAVLAFRRLIVKCEDLALQALTFLAMFNPLWWGTHITIDPRIIDVLNWALMTFGDNFVFIAVTHKRPYVVSNLNINMEGGRFQMIHDYMAESAYDDHVEFLAETRDGYGLYVVGNWGSKPIPFKFELKTREAFIRSTFLDIELSRYTPIFVYPKDYASVKYRA